MDDLAQNENWQKVVLQGSPFDLVAYLPGQIRPADQLTIYIEGDGLAWRSRTRPSDNPTPIDPLAFKLAIKHPKGNATYLARPCQFSDHQEKSCTQKYWTDARFSEEVINPTNHAIDQLKKRFQAKELILVGYSGGGAIAALITAKRDDVKHLITIAGNLDHRSWTDKHHLSPLTGSLNPAERINALKEVKQ